MKYVCELCGWVYDEDRGPCVLDIEAGTRFDEIPDDFECPRCHANKEAFSEVDD